MKKGLPPDPLPKNLITDALHPPEIEVLSFTIKKLKNGGLITNYFCTSRCGHCLYACSPAWPKKYIDHPTAEKNLAKIRSLGCKTIHIGGGEPFLNVQQLGMVIEAAADVGIEVEYVETNSSWFKDHQSACHILKDLRQRGLKRLLISISPFHNEHIPLAKVKGLLAACEKTGMEVFPWITSFFPEIDAFDDNKPHRLTEYEERFGPHYLAEIPKRYWIHLGGRALSTFARVFRPTPLDDLLKKNRGGCRELLDVTHFHFDLFGHYIPGLCSGLAIKTDDMGKPLINDEYPILNTLHTQGIQGLLEMAQHHFNFEPVEAYLSKCHLCTHIRQTMVINQKMEIPEISPYYFYKNLV